MTDVWLYVCYEDRMHSPYWNAMYFPRPDRWLLCPVDVCLMQFVCRCGPVISHLIKQTSGPLESFLQHPADGNRKLVRFQSCFLYMFAFRTLRNVLKKFSMRDLPTQYTTTIIIAEKTRDLQQARKFPAFYGIRMFITVYTTAHHLSLSGARRIQCTPLHVISYYQSIKLYFWLYSYSSLFLLLSWFVRATIYCF